LWLAGAPEAVPPGFWPGTESRRAPGIDRAPGDNGRSPLSRLIGLLTFTDMREISGGNTATR
jgi:hypothetical protein